MFLQSDSSLDARRGTMSCLMRVVDALQRTCHRPFPRSRPSNLEIKPKRTTRLISRCLCLGVEPKIMGFYPPNHPFVLIGFGTLIFTIHFGVPLFLETPVFFVLKVLFLWQCCCVQIVCLATVLSLRMYFNTIKDGTDWKQPEAVGRG